jgi:hypothetical protein
LGTADPEGVDSQSELSVQQSKPFALSLSKRCPFLETINEKRGFDKLSPNGLG